MYTLLKIAVVVLAIFLSISIILCVKLIRANKEIEKLQKEKQLTLKAKDYYLNLVNQSIKQDSYYDLGER